MHQHFADVGKTRMSEQAASLPQVLVVDDDPEIRNLLSNYLGERGLRVATAGNGHEMDMALGSSPPDLVVLDLRLGPEFGLDLLKRLRLVHRDLPIIMLTGEAEESDKVAGLELGADDYVAKPFSPRELLARIRSRLRIRDVGLQTDPIAPSSISHASPTPVNLVEHFRFAGWKLFVRPAHLLSAAGQQIPLAQSEFQLLLAFVQYPRKTLTRDQLLDISRRHGDEVFDRSIDVAIFRLRQKMKDNAETASIIRTVRGLGYVLDADVERIEPGRP